ncbi:DUF3102 domain-containing protein [Clostridium butyricum]|uniref:Uncharacterized protein n=1 Tax=Clostridium butyricum TaxID=1492 RepID=A0A6N3AVV9_CLOBU|nr:DUF3102 domain-containing protein [Clostridium butyricum]ETI88392.1 MAG: hypothetical protein Q607_CBUC00202G0003 [Clostridium butyricum DORA_1]MDU1509722.1 DUF3102 domain-containing protein [Clostridium butyricum]MDU3583060.1 DUF3102 domain-containing protein [Clostridium butyricum]MDU3596191.1 DUF3102 domain-containing protein [Clostridium butyricum]MDU4800292.1 DUF3102 domain-containing protein [Clostridium butyricum]
MLTSEEKQLVELEKCKNVINVEQQKIGASINKIAGCLIKVKGILPKLEWNDWLKNNVDFTVNTANRYIRSVKIQADLIKMIPNKKVNIDNLNTWSLIEIGKLKRDQQKELIENSDINSMSTRDIALKVKEIKKCDNAQKDKSPNKSIQLTQNIIKNDDKNIDDIYNATVKLNAELLNRVGSKESIEETLVARYKAEEIKHHQISDIVAKYKLNLPVFFNKELFEEYIKNNDMDIYSQYEHYASSGSGDSREYYEIFNKELEWSEVLKCYDHEDEGCVDWCKSNHIDNKEFQLAIGNDGYDDYLCIYKGYKLKGTYMNHDITDIERLCEYDTSLDLNQLKDLYDKLNISLEAYRIRQEIRNKKQKAEYEAKRAQREKYDDALRSWREIYQPWVMGKWTFEDIWNDEGDIKDFKIWLEMTEFVSKERKKSYGDAFNSYSSFFGGAGGNNKGVVSEEDKPTYKKLYRILAKNCHPDIIKDDGQTMKLVNELKEQWGI